MNFFANKIRSKSPAELVKVLKDNSIKLEAGYAANNSMEIRKVGTRPILGRYSL